MSSVISISREELYKKVWETPMQRLAKEFSISDVGLAKICRKHKIPLPERGYWRKAETGKKAQKRILPSLPDGASTQIRIKPTLNPPSINIQDQKILQLIEQEKTDAHKICVDFNRELLHAFTIRTQRYLHNAKTNSNGMLSAKNRSHNHIHVSRELLARSLCILDTILVALTARGFKVLWKKSDTHISIIKDNIRLTFQIHEAVNRKDHIPTKEEKIEMKKWSLYSPPKWEFYSSGKLRLTLQKQFYITGIRNSWGDGLKQKVENFLNDFIISCYLMVETEKNQIVKNKEREIAAAEWRIKEQERQHQEYIYKRKIEYILKSFQHWEQASKLREYINQLSKSIEAINLSDEGKKYANEFIHMAARYADTLNPLMDIEGLIRKFENA